MSHLRTPEQEQVVAHPLVHLQTTVLSDEQIEDIQAICAEVGSKLETATFEQKRQIIDMLDVRGTLAIENEEKVVYVKCILGQQLLSVARILPLSSNHKGTQITVRARLVIVKSISWATV
jgi:hypothetical protein